MHAKKLVESPSTCDNKKLGTKIVVALEENPVLFWWKIIAACPRRTPVSNVAGVRLWKLVYQTNIVDDVDDEKFFTPSSADHGVTVSEPVQQPGIKQYAILSQ